MTTEKQTVFEQIAIHPSDYAKCQCNTIRGHEIIMAYQEQNQQKLLEFRQRIKDARKESAKRYLTDKGEGELIAYDHVLAMLGEPK